jgi:hypothetical protein
MRVREVSSLGAHKREETSRSMRRSRKERIKTNSRSLAKPSRRDLRRSGLSGVFIRGEPPNKKTTRQRTKPAKVRANSSSPLKWTKDLPVHFSGLELLAWGLIPRWCRAELIPEVESGNLSYSLVWSAKLRWELN